MGKKDGTFFVCSIFNTWLIENLYAYEAEYKIVQFVHQSQSVFLNTDHIFDIQLTLDETLLF